jgi:hypothetical protein
MSITDLSAVRVLKKMGAPLNTPVEFSRAYSERWFALNDAHTKFLTAIDEYTSDGSCTSARKWKLVRRRLGELRFAKIRCEIFLNDKKGDLLEKDILANFLINRAIPFLDYWEDAADAVDEGASLVINPGDVPLWTDD